MVGLLNVQAVAFFIASLLVVTLLVFLFFSRRPKTLSLVQTLVLLAVAYSSMVFWVLFTDLDGGSSGRALFLFTVAMTANVLLAAWIFRKQRLGKASTLGPLGQALALNVLLMVVTFPITSGGSRPMSVEPHQGSTPARRDLPNILLIILDTVRADHMSIYGYRLPTTPNLEAFAERATTFTHAYSNSTFSLPSHASILTGLLPHQHGAHARVVRDEGSPERPQVEIAPVPLAEAFVTIPEHLRAEGVSTALVAANHAYLGPEYGLTQGFRYVDSRSQNLLPVEFLGGPFIRNFVLGGPFIRFGPEWMANQYEWLSQSTYPAGQIVDNVRFWLETHDRAPFFLMVNFMDAHEPGTAPFAVRRIREIEADFAEHTEDDSIEFRYDLAIRYADHHLERLFEELRLRNLFDETMIVITSDHGETFFPNDEHRHAGPTTQSQIHVPLLIKMPGQQEARVVHELTHGIDILPTMLDVIGVSAASDLPGTRAGTGGIAIAESFADPAKRALCALISPTPSAG